VRCEAYFYYSSNQDSQYLRRSNDIAAALPQPGQLIVDQALSWRDWFQVPHWWPYGPPSVVHQSDITQTALLGFISREHLSFVCALQAPGEPPGACTAHNGFPGWELSPLEPIPIPHVCKIRVTPSSRLTKVQTLRSAPGELPGGSTEICYQILPVHELETRKDAISRTGRTSLVTLRWRGRAQLTTRFPALPNGPS